MSPDPCATVRLAADGTCDADGEYAACDPDCFPSEPATGAAGAGGASGEPVADPPADPCANIRVAPDGECDPNDDLAMCDPDCPMLDPNDPANDPCATIRIAPDGQCDENSAYAACDPDCSCK